jgi:hypothetical protein
MIRTLLRVERKDIESKGKDLAFVEALISWEILPWIKYLRKYGKVINVEHYVESEYYTDTYQLTWELQPEHETWFHLNFSEDVERIKRLT